MAELENINPSVYKKKDERKVTSDDYNEDVVDPIDEREVFGNFKYLFSMLHFYNPNILFRFDKKYK